MNERGAASGSMYPSTRDLYQPMRLGRRLAGPVFGVACFSATLTGVVVLALLLGSLFISVSDRARPAGSSGVARLDGLRTAPSYLVGLTTRFRSSRPALAGYKAGVACTLWLLGLVAATAIPAGVGAAVFLEEYVPPGRIRRLIQTNIANLAGVPSIVYGILGLAVFVRGFGFKSMALGPTLWSGALTLSLLILPIIVIATQEALRTVPTSIRQAALALGASRWQMVRDHVLPAALPGIMTGAILGLSRAIGETAPLIMVGAAASILAVPSSPGDAYTALPVEIYNYARNPNVGFRGVVSGGILVLLTLLLSMNAAAILLRNRTAPKR